MEKIKAKIKEGMKEGKKGMKDSKQQRNAVVQGKEKAEKRGGNKSIQRQKRDVEKEWETLRETE